jgi:hypothetical protein
MPVKWLLIRRGQQPIAALSGRIIDVSNSYGSQHDEPREGCGQGGQRRRSALPEHRAHAAPHGRDGREDGEQHRR